MMPDASEPRFPIVTVDVAEDEADEGGVRLFELGAAGVEHRDATTLVHAERGATVRLVASFATADEARAAAEALPDAWCPRAGEIVGDAWLDAWKAHFEPFVLCQTARVRVVVRPPWVAYARLEDEQVIVLEPGRAFGTGLHETTRLVAQILAERAASIADDEVLDVGCGSGILSLVALALGASGARAVDIDPDAIAVTHENADRNGWGGRIQADDRRLDALGTRYPTVLANIEARTLVAMAPSLMACVASGGTLVLGGILAPEVSPSQWQDVRDAYAAMAVDELRRDGEWMAVALRA
ncbi:MAG: 50S ribosomal protein L11 methyltransferase [Polyangiaceae bacterium]|jgi:ribosomal protein L11 methyltransferase